VPSTGNQPYSTRVTDAAGNPLTDLYGIDLGDGIVLGSGNPGDDGVAMGVQLQIVRTAKDNSYATVHVDPGNH
jgi:immune inhibitor A